MKAFHCYVSSPEYGSLLVYAADRNKARYIAAHSCWEEWDYVDITAIRANPEFDDIYTEPCYIDSNDALPDHIKFYEESY